MKIVVLGANGFIGSNLTKYLKNNYEKFPYDELIEVTDIDYFLSSNWDLLRDSVLIDCVGVKPFYYMQGDTFSRNDSLYFSLISRYNQLVNFCVKTNSNFIFISSGGSVYGRYRGEPWKETDLVNPVDAYGKACHDVENLIKTSNGIVVRGSNIYGALKRNRQGQGIITELLISYLTDSKIRILNNGQTVRDYLYIDDFINALCNIAFNFKRSPNVVNLSSGVGLNQLELIEVFKNSLTRQKMPQLDSLIDLTSKSYDLIDINVLNPQLYISIFGEINSIDISLGINNMINKLFINK
jgi:UDP-glucose 4-epimerase